jgi:hypothetical protein
MDRYGGMPLYLKVSVYPLVGTINLNEAGDTPAFEEPFN